MNHTMQNQWPLQQCKMYQFTKLLYDRRTQIISFPQSTHKELTGMTLGPEFTQFCASHT